MQLVLNPKQVNTLRRITKEEQPIEFGGILNSTYKSSIKNSSKNKSSLNNLKKRVSLYKFRYSTKLEAILKVSIFTAVIIGVFA